MPLITHFRPGQLEANQANGWADACVPSHTRSDESRVVVHVECAGRAAYKWQLLGGKIGILVIG